MTVVPAPAGSGKTVLLRSWIAEAGPAGLTAWVVGRLRGNADSVRDEIDRGRFGGLTACDTRREGYGAPSSSRLPLRQNLASRGPP